MHQSKSTISYRIIYISEQFVYLNLSKYIFKPLLSNWKSSLMKLCGLLYTIANIIPKNLVSRFNQSLQLNSSFTFSCTALCLLKAILVSVFHSLDRWSVSTKLVEWKPNLSWNVCVDLPISWRLRLWNKLLVYMLFSRTFYWWSIEKTRVRMEKLHSLLLKNVMTRASMSVWPACRVLQSVTFLL